jgi:broad specificity phosphatase PhoE
MTRILLVRHGHVEGIDPERFRGRTDVPLSDLGRRQAAATAARIASNWSIAAIYTSPMGRCVQTGAAIAAAAGVSASCLEALNDLDYGDWQWKTYAEVAAASPALFERWRTTPELVRFPSGDSLQDLTARTADALRLTLERHADEAVVMVGHDSVNRVILMQALAQPLTAYWRLAQSPCAINEIDIEDGWVRVLRMNETAHLEAP